MTKENKASRRDQKIKHLKMIGEVYRQLKRNQMEAKDWREAGDAYRSEMVINRILQWQQFLKTGSLSRILNLLVISVHGGRYLHTNRAWLGLSFYCFLLNLVSRSPECLIWLGNPSNATAFLIASLNVSDSVMLLISAVSFYCVNGREYLCHVSLVGRY